MSVEQTEMLKLKLATINKQALRKETEVCKLRNVERSYSDELALLNAEIDFLKQQLEELKATLSQLNQQFAMIDVCQISENSKINTQMHNVQNHRGGFEIHFEKDRYKSELQNRELEKMETVKRELRKQKEKEIADKNEQHEQDALATEAECDCIERDCTVLKKRNNAIMLKLRRKLVETENIRRDLMKKKGMDISEITLKLTDDK